jgi:hypothetical protein
MKNKRPPAATALLAAWMTVAALPLQAAPRIELDRRHPCNLFAKGEPIRLTLALKGFAGEATSLAASLRNYFGHEVWRHAGDVPLATGRPTVVTLDAGIVEPGYYEMICRAGGVTTTNSLGVADLTRRTAAEARAGGCRFGLKVFQIGPPGVWWRRPLQWNLAEALDASVALGLNWTRHSFNQRPLPDEPGIVGTVELTTRHEMNVVYKIEGIPEQAYDAARYGPIGEYNKKNRKGWSRTTVPLEAPYQTWLAEQIAVLPASQNVFEIGNEVWNYMSAEEFAEWCRMAVPVVRRLRPDAVIGADPGTIAWGRRFIRAGGMKGMNAQFIHPYSFTPLPEHRVRAWLRNRGDFLEQELGRRLDTFVTEYGWSTAPRDPRGKAVTERVQAQRTTRQSLMLYAEGCKTLIPHWMADREQDPTDWDQWFGFFRLNGEPKPVAIAHSVCARMIDGSRFVGDLWYGPGIGALLFDRAGTLVLALWTLDETPGAGRELVLDTDSDRVRVVDLMGRARELRTDAGRVTLKLDADVRYVEGVGTALVAQAVPPDGDLEPDRWTRRAEGGAVVARAAGDHQADADLIEWHGLPAVTLSPAEGRPPAEVRAQAQLAWDDACLHVAFRLTGQQAGKPGVFELLLGTRPSRQLDLADMGIYDFALLLSPPSATGPATLKLANCLWERPIANPAPDDPSGIRWAVAGEEHGWTAEISLPRRTLHGFPARAGAKALSGVLQWKADGLRLASSRVDTGTSREWPFLDLRD